MRSDSTLVGYSLSGPDVLLAFETRWIGLDLSELNSALAKSFDSFSNSLVNYLVTLNLVVDVRIAA